MKTFLEFLQESVIDPHKDSLAPEIFDSYPSTRLRTIVRSQILQGLKHLEVQAGVKVLATRLIGSILTHRYSHDSDLDINVLISGDIKKAVPIATSLSGRRAAGSSFVINYHVLDSKPDFDSANADADGVFDIANNRFERVPRDIPFDMDLYWRSFQSVASRIRSLSSQIRAAALDYKQLEGASHTDLSELHQKALQKLRALEKPALELVDIYNHIRQQRIDVFAKGLTPQAIMKYGEKNRMPPNVIYKLLEKYSYLKLLHQISGIIGSTGTLTDREAREIAHIFNKPVIYLDQ